MSYEKEFKIFSTNVEIAAMSFYYLVKIDTELIKSFEDLPNEEPCSTLYEAMNSNADFWQHHQHIAKLGFIITLGRIFDTTNNSYNSQRVLNMATNSDILSKPRIRERKIASSENAHTWIDQYIAEAHDFSSKDVNELTKYCSTIKHLWDKDLKDLRNKVYAHQDISKPVFNKVERDVSEDIINRLLTIRHILWEAYTNGKKPDFAFKDKSVQLRVKKDITSLLEKITLGFNTQQDVF